MPSVLIACAAILASSNLSEAADNQERYAVPQRLGYEKTMAQRALLAQMGVYFLFLLGASICHSVVAVPSSVDDRWNIRTVSGYHQTAHRYIHSRLVIYEVLLSLYLMARNIVLSRKANRL